MGKIRVLKEEDYMTAMRILGEIPSKFSYDVVTILLKAQQDEETPEPVPPATNEGTAHC